MHLTADDLSRLADPALAGTPQAGDSLALLQAKALGAPPPGWRGYSNDAASHTVAGPYGPVNGDGTVDTWDLHLTFTPTGAGGTVTIHGSTLDIPPGGKAANKGYAKAAWTAATGDVLAVWHGRPPVV